MNNVGLILMFLIVLIILSSFFKPFKFLLSSFIRGAVGVVCYTVFNMATAMVGISVGVNAISVLAVMFLGIPGFISMYILQFIL